MSLSDSAACTEKVMDRKCHGLFLRDEEISHCSYVRMHVTIQEAVRHGWDGR